jgi:type II secretory pathway pseudopilin PulG
MRNARKEEGFALVAAIIVMLIVLGLGLALLSYSDVQQRAATRQGSKEQGFVLAEAAMNAQIFELSSQWPTAAGNAPNPFPSSCGPGSAGASFCPNPSNQNGGGSFGNGYSPGGPSACPATTPHDAWNQGAPVNNGWTTYVRDDGPGTTTQNLFDSTTDQSQPAYDSNNDGVVWVRAVGVVNCQPVTVLSRVSEQVVHLNFPQDAINANGFEISNNGNHTIVDILGYAAQPSQISARCNGLGGQPPSRTTCVKYDKNSEVSPAPTYANPPGAAQTLTASQLTAVRSQAIANGTYFSPSGGNPCPTDISQLTGPAVYIQGCGALSFTGRGIANSAPGTSPGPGFLVDYDGTLDFNGNTRFYGIVYAVNAQQSSGDVVTLHGNTCVSGGIDVDGNGTINFGSSGNGCLPPDNNSSNLAFDQNAFHNASISAGAQSTPNTFRVLPQGQ